MTAGDAHRFDFEFTWVIFTIFWLMSLREACDDGLMCRWRLADVVLAI
jgi:hypothetical protein